jgi:8-oxo-dGTP pyrophosphatase MutT (NUDIX family)
MGKARKQDTSYGIVPVRRSGEELLYLLIQHNAGHWAFPKGHAEGEETPRESALRELAEETGIDEVELLHDEPFPEAYVIHGRRKVTDKTVWFFVGLTEIASVYCQPEEVQAYAWLTEDAAAERLTFDASRKTLSNASEIVAASSRGRKTA